MKLQDLFENDNDEIAEEILQRLKDNYDSKHTEDDAVQMRASIKRNLKDGWSVADIVAHMKYMEEVNPEMDEDRALAAMKKISDKYKS